MTLFWVVVLCVFTVAVVGLYLDRKDVRGCRCGECRRRYRW